MKMAGDRTCYVGAPEIFGLVHALLIVEAAFGDECYLVGSATERREFRDIDVRMIFSDEKWSALFGSGENGKLSAFWSLLCTSISEYLQKRTGLKIDFQIQRRSSVTQADWNKVRDPLCMFVTNHDPDWKSRR